MLKLPTNQSVAQCLDGICLPWWGSLAVLFPPPTSFFFPTANVIFGDLKKRPYLNSAKTQTTLTRNVFNHPQDKIDRTANWEKADHAYI